MATELRALLASDYEVVETVQDGAALVDAVRRHAPDAIVSDIGMPGVNGLTAAAVILAATPEACIVFVTVEDSVAVVRKALALGALGYVLKSDAANELVAAVRAAIAGRSYLSADTRGIVERER